MSLMFEVRPGHDFEDMATMFTPKNTQSSVCCCLSWRLSSRKNRKLKGTGRADMVRELCSRDLAPGVLAHIDGEVAGWAGIAPRFELHPFANSRKIPHHDSPAIWSLWWVRVRPGYRKPGVTRAR